jgi:uncharacterized protein (DUF427 family)
VRVRFGGTWIADSEHVLLLFEPDRYPVAYFPETDILPGTLQPSEHTTRHRDFGATSWYTVRAGEQSAPRAAWRHTGAPAYASELQARVAFAWPAMEAFYEEDERILGLLPTATTASISARHHAGSWSVIMTARSPIPGDRGCSSSQGSRHVGTCHAWTSTNPR